MNCKYVLLPLLLFVMAGCAKQEKTPIDVNVYHWKSSWGFQEPFKKVVKDLKSKKVYVRFFDVIYNEEKGEARPSAELAMKGEQMLGSFTIVPVVYFENKVFQDDSTDYVGLSRLMLSKLNRMSETFGFGFRELQIDCDWTQKTKDNFFEFCEGLKKVDDSLKLSATIRLHQIKYPEITGIPPVDQGVLMFYNMGDLSDSSETNSILNWDKAEAYLGQLENYPLELSLALPTFAWGVVYDENGTKALINNLTIEDLEVDFIEKIDQQNFKVKEDRYYMNTLFTANDLIRYESVQISELQDVWKELKNRREFKEVILYHLHGLNLANNEAPALHEVFN